MKAIDLEDIHLDSGNHQSPDEGMCVMEAVAWMRHQEDPSVPFNDAPACVSPVLRSFAISWNDRLPDDDRQELKKYIPLLPGTAGDAKADERRAWMATDWLVRVHTPAWLRLAGLTEQAEQLESLAELNPETCPTIEPTLRAVREDARKAWDAAWDAARDAAWDAAWDAARDAAWDAARAAAWDAARDAAWDAAWDAARAAARAAAWDAARAAARAAAWAAAVRAAQEGKSYPKQYQAAYDVLKPVLAEKLAPVRAELQRSAHDLFERMIAVGQKESVSA